MLLEFTVKSNDLNEIYRGIFVLHGTFLLGLAMYKAAEYWKMAAAFKGFTLVRILIRDQVIYFML